MQSFKNKLGSRKRNTNDCECRGVAPCPVTVVEFRYPGYRYQPVFRRTDIIRRRVRKDQAEDDKVEAVAEALIQGKSGEKLEKEIREQMIARSNEIASESEAESPRTASGRSR